LTNLIVDKNGSLLNELGVENSEQGSQIKNLLKQLELNSGGKKYPLISIVIPLYNEEKTIRKVLESLPNDPSIEIIVVDDNSTDNSILEIRKIIHNKNIRILQHDKNKGYGSALLTGISHARGEILVTMDSDGQHRADDLYNLIKPIVNGEADITIGSRYIGSYHYDLPFSTRFGEALLEIVIKLLFKQRIKNNQGGFRAFHKKTFKIFENIKFRGYAFTTELILAASLQGFEIKECPIKLLDREYGTSYIRLHRLTFSIFLCIILYFLKKVKRILLKK